MLVRIQYLLSVLLFVVLATVEPATPAPCGGCPDASVSVCGGNTLHLPDRTCGCIVAAFDTAIVPETLDRLPEAKLAGAADSAARTAACFAAAASLPSRLPACGYHPRPKDLYVYALGRIVI